MRLARWISILAHPFVLVAVMTVVAAARARDARSGVTAPIVVGLAILPVALLMARQVRSGRWGNADASHPSERPILFAVSLTAIGILLAWMLWREPESFLVRGLAVGGGLVCASAVLTRWIKVSLHASFGALAATTLTLIGSPVGYALLVVLPALAWSRLALGRHRPAEVALGGALGVLAGFVLAA